MSTLVLKMSLTHASTLGVAARAVADTVGALGLGPAERTHLEALMSEALTAVIADSFDGADVIDVDVAVNHEPGSVNIVLQQRGALLAPGLDTGGDNLAQLFRVRRAETRRRDLNVFEQRFVGVSELLYKFLAVFDLSARQGLGQHAIHFVELDHRRFRETDRHELTVVDIDRELAG